MDATWKVRAALTNAAVLADSHKNVAAAEIAGRLEQALPGWTVGDLQVKKSAQEGGWVTAEREPGRVEYARVVRSDAGELRIEFADGTRRGLPAELQDA